jgi:ABC-type bacteriocin/lantibiotic exporter with double-glycine peptidase domain
LDANRAVRLRVPFYRQASQFTCGPACLMMAMKYYQPSLSMSKDLEFDIWREASLVESYGTSKEGLALAAARRGFDVYTAGKYLRHSFVDLIADKIPAIDYHMLELLYRDTRRKFNALGIRNVGQPLNLRRLRSVLNMSHIPVLLTSTGLFGDDESLPHWIVVTGYSGAAWYVNNPLASSRSTRFEEARLKNGLGYQGIQCAIVVCGLRRQTTYLDSAC